MSEAEKLRYLMEKLQTSAGVQVNAPRMTGLTPSVQSRAIPNAPFSFEGNPGPLFNTQQYDWQRQGSDHLRALLQEVNPEQRIDRIMDVREQGELQYKDPDGRAIYGDDGKPLLGKDGSPLQHKRSDPNIRYGKPQEKKVTLPDIQKQVRRTRIPAPSSLGASQTAAARSRDLKWNTREEKTLYKARTQNVVKRSDARAALLDEAYTKKSGGSSMKEILAESVYQTGPSGGTILPDPTPDKFTRNRLEEAIDYGIRNAEVDVQNLNEVVFNADGTYNAEVAEQLYEQMDQRDSLSYMQENMHPERVVEPGVPKTHGSVQEEILDGMGKPAGVKEISVRDGLSDQFGDSLKPSFVESVKNETYETKNYPNVQEEFFGNRPDGLTWEQNVNTGQTWEVSKEGNRVKEALYEKGGRPYFEHEEVRIQDTTDFENGDDVFIDQKKQIKDLRGELQDVDFDRNLTSDTRTINEPDYHKGVPHKRETTKPGPIKSEKTFFSKDNIKNMVQQPVDLGASRQGMEVESLRDPNGKTYPLDVEEAWVYEQGAKETPQRTPVDTQALADHEGSYTTKKSSRTGGFTGDGDLSRDNRETWKYGSRDGDVVEFTGQGRADITKWSDKRKLDTRMNTRNAINAQLGKLDTDVRVHLDDIKIREADRGFIMPAKHVSQGAKDAGDLTGVLATEIETNAHDSYKLWKKAEAEHFAKFKAKEMVELARGTKTGDALAKQYAIQGDSIRKAMQYAFDQQNMLLKSLVPGNKTGLTPGFTSMIKGTDWEAFSSIVEMNPELLHPKSAGSIRIALEAAEKEMAESAVKHSDKLVRGIKAALRVLI